MSTVRMDGAPVRDAILAGLAARMSAAGNPHVCLATVLVGDDAPSARYVASKHRTAGSLGIASVGVELPGTATQAEVEREVARLAADPGVHGILVQMPLPAHLDAERVLALIPADKDVDGLTETSLGRLVRGVPGHVGCTPLGVMRLLEHNSIETAGRRAVVIGRSTLVGLPMVLLLARKGADATVTLAHSRTADLVEVCREADIVVSATGAARSIGAAHTKRGAVLVDVGISRTENGIVGDIDFDAVQGIASAVTPMPGGTGILTVACLMENTLAAAAMQGVRV
ncbi:MAG: bifunctional 5,10-methylenetetrahydrofolate dehydrogenase/5,10-methenyltetrahydrofolate cyclohydrolase [Actinobacteria bacterium]|nr:bifunctional 5,10-methylenetetrahydrofolate dehydrogenase/5,10-methenyltetrahydrofolate cyclohydrolase [Actinomycetota bacterium]NBR66462.1 bifunctional 5,10-methylenetetrahydrofolate dehydrogenase/5,10-methenyltetrahydrofolate cyclohydrolase [Actinomycetota bacterium]NBU15552.1 bifunctional 5,10-methylenetetrahydrofolate dehydrogenase/5,10-methenyltetrahydrofolate cyclohydrolase [Actinomycetota bacterium]